ncbi:LuxR family transcriptional regulator [Sphingobacterium siyangense subsp. cladoniae]|uniref:response regulator transcription factor n=1 Tax=Sphingobacterium siyangense TaxID=459529 RepID=UPI0031F894B0
MLNLNKISQVLPAGLEDNGVEFYVHNNDIKCLHKGKTFDWENIPNWILEVVAIDMLQNQEALNALVAWDLTQRDEMLKQYIICRFGGFDLEPDIDSKGNIDHTEFFDCGRRGNCVHEGKLCATIKVANGFLTKQEVKVLRCVAQGKFNKEIADILSISEDTVSTHNQNIQRKLGVDNKLEMVSFAILKNIR